jgi:hypothetical protein
VRIVQKLTMGERLKEVTTGMILFDSVWEHGILDMIV